MHEEWVIRCYRLHRGNIISISALRHDLNQEERRDCLLFKEKRSLLSVTFTVNTTESMHKTIATLLKKDGKSV